MSLDDTHGFGSLPNDQAAAIDAVCEVFEAAWREGGRPRLENHLDGFPDGPARIVLVHELLAVEIAWRHRFGERPSDADYRAHLDALHCPFIEIPEPTTQGATPPHVFASPADDFSMDEPAETGVDPAERILFRVLRDAVEDTVDMKDHPQGGPTSDPSLSGVHSSRFRHVKHHASGGLGHVYIANDVELRRQVALKEIQDEFADDEASRARFLVEAEVTAHLEHPGVVPVYGLGRYQNGRPYYAMRFIQGESLGNALTRFHAETKGQGRRAFLAGLRPLLARFIAVCDAIAYAHSKSVVHRDLKPSNIMLGPFGETLVVDWGLAKVLAIPQAPGASEPDADVDLDVLPWTASTHAATQHGSAVGTPPYMSPEQAAGDLDRVGLATDIYSLGATLYALLTGRQPYRDKNQNVVRAQVIAGQYPPPRDQNIFIPRALAAIVKKAMALDPDDRYPSPLALRQDVDRWLADEPVSANRETPLDRLLRWTRHHRSPVLAGGVVLLAVALISTAAAVGINAARVREQSARQTSDENLADMRILADDLLFPNAESTFRIPEQHLGTRRQVVDRSLAVYQSLLRQSPRETGLRFKTSQVFRESANIFRNEDRFHSSFMPYRRAITLLRDLVHQFPENFDFHESLAETLNDLAESLRASGKFQDALPLYDEAVEIASRGLEHPSARHLNARTTLATCYADLGAGLADLGRIADAVAAYQQAISYFAPLEPELRKPNQQGYRLQYALVRADLADLLVGLGRIDEAEAALTIGRDDVQAIPIEYTFNADTRYVLARLHLGLGRIHARNPSRLARAHADLLAALRLATLLESQGMERNIYTLLLADALDSLAAVRLDADPSEVPNPLAEADDLYAAHLARILLARQPDIPDHLALAGRTLANLARHALARRAPDEARALLSAAIAYQELVLKARPEDQFVQAFLHDHRAALDRLR